MSKLDMSLAEISKKMRSQSKKKGGRGRGRGRGRRGRGRGRGQGGSRKKRYTPDRSRNNNNSRRTPYKKSQPGSSQISITNLDFAVTEADVREIFSKVGKVKKAVVHYNARGKSRGTAVVSFGNATAAGKAVKEYHQAEVDGRPMYVKLLSTSGAASPKRVQKRPQKKVSKKKAPQKGRRNRGRGRRGRGRGRGRGGFKKQKTKTADELDKEMDDYYSKGDAATIDAVAAGQPDTAKLFSTDGAEE